MSDCCREFAGVAKLFSMEASIFVCIGVSAFLSIAKVGNTYLMAVGSSVVRWNVFDVLWSQFGRSEAYRPVNDIKTVVKSVRTGGGHVRLENGEIGHGELHGNDA